MDWSRIVVAIAAGAAGALAGWFLPCVARAYEQLLRQGRQADAATLWRACQIAWCYGTRRSRLPAATDPCRDLPARIRLLSVIAVVAGMGLLVARHGFFSLIFALHVGLLVGMVLLALIDHLTGLLPDAVLAPLAGLGLIGLASGWTVPLAHGLLAAGLAGGLLTATRALVTRWSGREALGWGDVKLFVMLGLWLGVQGLLGILLLANLLVLAASVLRRPGQVAAAEHPFGPFVTLAFLVMLAFEPASLS